MEAVGVEGCRWMLPMNLCGGHAALAPSSTACPPSGLLRAKAQAGRPLLTCSLCCDEDLVDLGSGGIRRAECKTTAEQAARCSSSRGRLLRGCCWDTWGGQGWDSAGKVRRTLSLPQGTWESGWGPGGSPGGQLGGGSLVRGPSPPLSLARSTCTGRCCSRSLTIPSTAATCVRGTFWLQEPSAGQ